MRLSILSAILLVASSSSVYAKKKVNRRCVSNPQPLQTDVALPNGNLNGTSPATSSASRTRNRTKTGGRRPTATASLSAADNNQGTSTSSSSSSTITDDSSPTTKSRNGSKSRTSTSSSASATSSSGSSNNNGTSSGGNGKVYSVQDSYEGQSFFDGFDFDDFADPTHGNVQYLPQDKATAAGLAYVQDDGTVVMKVDNTNTYPSGGQRPSVRISSKNSYTEGLIVLDVQSMPYGCGVWPAFWTVGGAWPAGGEIDIVEGVNNVDHNQYTLHTSDGCTLDTSFALSTSKRRRHHKSRRGNSSTANSVSAMAFTGKALATTCDALVNGNAGCGIQDPSDTSYGQGLNDNGGGVFATLLDDNGVAIWFFPRDSIPDDLTNKKPQPSGWGNPKAFWSSQTCSTGKFFGAQNIVINTTLCGDWAGAVYSQDPTCPGTCADRIADPSNFDTAQWKINSVAVYN